jgi:hypothetical protein
MHVLDVNKNFQSNTDGPVSQIILTGDAAEPKHVRPVDGECQVT